jgi:hypothetical protein
VISQPPQLLSESLDGVGAAAEPAPAPVLRTRVVVARAANGQPRTYRLSPRPTQQAAYRRLALAIIGLDVASLADELRAARRLAPALPHAA